MNQPRKIIIDTDPGVDDALAIALAAYSPELEICGLTTIFGNVSVEQSTQNAAFLADLMDLKVPIAKGASEPLYIAAHGYPDFVHGKNGLGDIALDYPRDFAPHVLDGADFIIETVRAHPGEVSLLPIGPLTNIALALKRAPDVAHLVKEVVLMGGSVNHRGNVSPVAEANIWNDPHAAQAVFSAPWPVTMVGLNVTHHTIMHEDRIRALAQRAPKVGGFLSKICGHYAHFYRNTAGFDGFSVHDPAALIQFLRPELFTTESGQIEVVCEGLATGLTMFGPQGFPWAEPGWGLRNNVKVCTGVQSEMVLTTIEQILSRAP